MRTPLLIPWQAGPVVKHIRLNHLGASHPATPWDLVPVTAVCATLRPPETPRFPCTCGEHVWVQSVLEATLSP
jgi:hypothetical protein